MKNKENSFKMLKKENKQSFQQEIPAKKKQYGQHFLRKQSTVDHMIESVEITPQTTILEIGCGDGFLTEAILKQTACKQLVCYEIDPEWVSHVKRKLSDPRLMLILGNILDSNFESLATYQPLVVLANLPYQITFPLFFLFQEYRHLFVEGVVMIQEEVAQKIVAAKGKSYNATSMFLQHYFDFKLLEKVEPTAFVPPPKVYSRLIYFKPKAQVEAIPHEEDFWKFLKLCFKSPRQTLKNNLRTTHYELDKIAPELLPLRAQQISFEQFLEIWKSLDTALSRHSG